jgi:hypothetical protein
MSEYSDSGPVLENALITQIQQLNAPLEPKPTGISDHLVALENIHAGVFDVYRTLFVSGSGDTGCQNILKLFDLFRY